MSERAAEKGELEAKNTALESEVSRLSGEVKVAAQNARASSGQVRRMRSYNHRWRCVLVICTKKTR